MTYFKFFIIILVVALAVYFYYLGVYKPKPPNYQRNRQVEESPTATKQWETKISEEPPVVVEVTPVELGPTASQWKFDVIFTTHSGSLDDDPMGIASMADDKGNIYRPSAWEGPGPGGHHREGILIFAPIQPTPKFIELKIKDVGGVAERSFMWNLD